MANKKITELTATVSLATTDVVPVVTDPAGSPATKKITVADMKASFLTAPTVTGGLTVSSGGAAITGTVSATTFSGSGASLTNLPAANITGTLPAISGANLTSLNASNLASGTVAAARLPTTFTSQIAFNAGVSFPSQDDCLSAATKDVASTKRLATIGADYVYLGGDSVPAMANLPTMSVPYWQWVRVDYLSSGGVLKTGYIPIITNT